jgi:hypothetical protein
MLGGDSEKMSAGSSLCSLLLRQQEISKTDREEKVDGNDAPPEQVQTTRELD